MIRIANKYKFSDIPK